jgi:hypothetical protein
MVVRGASAVGGVAMTVDVELVIVVVIALLLAWTLVKVAGWS